MTEQRQDLYFNLIEQLLNCPNGQEPVILDNQPELLDAGLVKTMIQVATVMAHQDNQNAAKFLIHVARQLAKQLELYPQLNSVTSDSVTSDSVTSQLSTVNQQQMTNDK